MTTIELKNDKYKRSRGGHSKLLDIQCAKCHEHLFNYQKDGTGTLKRMYLDRIYDSMRYSGLENISIKDVPKLICPKCNEIIGLPYTYKKENRSALRIVNVGVVKKMMK